MKLDLELEEINAILQTLGELPTKSGVWNLLMKIKQQAEEQIKQEQIKQEQPKVPAK